MSAPAPRLILVGRVAGAFGVRGEVRITAFTRAPEGLLAHKTLLDKAGRPALTLLSGRPVKGGVIVRTSEIADKEAADAARGLELHIPREALPEPEADEFYLADLIGLAVVDVAGGPLGVVRSVQNFGAGDLLEVRGLDGDVWLPFTREAVPQVDLAAGRITAAPPPEVE